MPTIGTPPLLTSSEASHLSTLLGREISADGVRAAARSNRLPVYLTTPSGVRLFEKDAVSRFALASDRRRAGRR